MSKLSFRTNIANAGIKIIVVDDEEKLLNNIVEYLKLELFEVKGFVNPIEAMEYISTNQVDVIISDIKMPGISGYDLITGVRNSSINKDTIFLFLSAKVEREDTRLGMSLQADDYITKPFKMTDLLDAINARLKLYKSRVELGKPNNQSNKNNIYLLLDKLSKSEIKIAYLIGQGKTNTQIAERLSISPKTVENHRTNMSDKLNITGRNKLIQLCIESKDTIKDYIHEKMRDIPYFF